MRRPNSGPSQQLKKMSTRLLPVIQEENKREDINEFITKFNHMFETTYHQVAKDCDQKRRDFHEYTKIALVSQTNSHDNQEEEEEYDWSETVMLFPLKRLKRKIKNSATCQKALQSKIRQLLN